MRCLTTKRPSLDHENDSQTIRNLDIVDTREKLEIYAKAGLLSLGAGAALASLGLESAGYHCLNFRQYRLGINSLSGALPFLAVLAAADLRPRPAVASLQQSSVPYWQ